MSVAPMMGHSHAAARRLWRTLCADALLYTEMVPAEAVIRDRNGRYRCGPDEGSVALQVAGDRPQALAEAARAAEGLGYVEVNLNCGCPSNSATAGGFGACMMLDPGRAAACVGAMADATDLPVSVKCRTGVDGQDPRESLFDFASKVIAAGCSKLAVHARKALLKGVSPRENRLVPPLDPGLVVDLARAHPGVPVVSNGGIETVAEASERAEGVSGVMLGRAVVARPELLAEFAGTWFGRESPAVADAVEGHLDFAARRIAAGDEPRRLLFPLAGLAAGRPGARAFRRALGEAARTGDVGLVAAAFP